MRGRRASRWPCIVVERCTISASTTRPDTEDIISPAHRPTPLTVDEIRSVALDCVRREGLQSLTMRRLASVLGVTPGSLYYHVGGKAQLTQLVLDAVLDELVLPPDDLDWQTWVEGLFATLATTLREYPGVVEHLRTEGNPSLSAWKLTDRVFGVLRQAGFDENETGTIFIALMTLVSGRVLAEQALPAQPPHAPGHSAFVEMFTDHQGELTNVAAVLPDLIARPPNVLTHDVVGLLIEGVEARRRRLGSSS